MDTVHRPQSFLLVLRFEFPDYLTIPVLLPQVKCGGTFPDHPKTELVYKVRLRKFFLRPARKSGDPPTTHSLPASSLAFLLSGSSRGDSDCTTCAYISSGVTVEDALPQTADSLSPWRSSSLSSSSSSWLRPNEVRRSLVVTRHFASGRWNSPKLSAVLVGFVYYLNGCVWFFSLFKISKYWTGSFNS